MIRIPEAAPALDCDSKQATWVLQTARTVAASVCAESSTWGLRSLGASIEQL